MKIELAPNAMVYPLPAALVSCGLQGIDQNIITIAWTGTICSEPPMCYISIRPGRHSHAIVMKHKAFVINLTGNSLAAEADWCGLHSGRNYDKFKEQRLTAVASTKVASVIIEEAAVNIECEVVEVKSLGSHDMFIARVVGIHCDDSVLNGKGEYPDAEKLGLISYAFRHYYRLGAIIGKQGFSLK